MKSAAKFAISSALLAAVLVGLIDIACGAFHPLASINTVNIDRGEPYNAVSAVRRQLKENDKNTNIVLLGSSLMVAPALQCQAMMSGRPFKRFHERRLTSFESLLQKSFKKERLPASSVNTYLLAMGGEMVSDAYMVTKELLPDLQGHGASNFIVYGIAPRDFHDNLFTRVDASPTFKIFAGMNDLEGLFASSPEMSFSDRAQAVCERLSSLYRYRSDWQNLSIIRSKRLIEKCLPTIVFDKYYDTLTLKPQKKGLLPGEAIGTPQVVPGHALDHDGWQATCVEYAKRYKPLNEVDTEAQFAYFEKLLKLSQDNKMSILVVNMPLSEENMALLPEGFYKKYLKRAGALSSQYGVEFADLNNGPWQEASNYVDSVHITPAKSLELMEKLADLTAHSNLALAQKKGVPGPI